MYQPMVTNSIGEFYHLLGILDSYFMMIYVDRMG